MLVAIVALYVERSQALLEDRCFLLEEEADRLTVAAFAAKKKLAEAAKKRYLDFRFNVAHHEGLSETLESTSSSHPPTEFFHA